MGILGKAIITSSSKKKTVLEKLGAVFAIDAAKSIPGEQWVLNRGSGGQVLRARYGSVARAEIRNGVGLILPGTTTNYASVPDAANLRLTSDIDVAVRYTLESLTPATWQSLACRWSTGVDRSFQFGITSGGSGLLAFQRTADGSTVDSLTSTANLATAGLAVGGTYWLRARTSGTVLTFEWAPDSPTKPTSWNALGGTRTLSGSSFWAGTAPFWVGVNTSVTNDPCAGTVKAVEYGPAGGASVLSIDFTAQTDLVSSFVASTGQTVTVAAANAVDTNDPLFLPWNGENYMYTPGTVNNLAASSSSAETYGTGFQIRMRLQASTWSGTCNICGHALGATPASRNVLMLISAGYLVVGISDGAGSYWSTCPTIPAGVLPTDRPIWVSATGVLNAGTITTMYEWAEDSPQEPTSWTSLGSAPTAFPGAIQGASFPFNFGSAYQNGTGSDFAGRTYRGIFRNGAGSTLIDADFTRNTGHSSFVCATGQTIMFNRSATGRKTTVVTRPIWLFGTDDYLEVADNDLLDFGSSDDFTVVVLLRRWANLATDTSIVNKKDGGGGADVGWQLSSGSGTTHYFQVSDGTNQNYDYAPTPVAGALTALAAVRRAAANQLEAFAGTVSNGTSSDSTGGLASSTQFRIGRFSGAGGHYGDFELLGVGIFRRALSAAEIAQIVSAYRAG